MLELFWFAEQKYCGFPKHRIGPKLNPLYCMQLPSFEATLFLRYKT